MNEHGTHLIFLSGKCADLSDDKDSFSQSDEDSDVPRDDDDNFADDEGMSHPDSSSLEYLDNYRYFEDDYEEHFYSPVLRISYKKGKPDVLMSGNLFLEFFVIVKCKTFYSHVQILQIPCVCHNVL